MQCDINFKIEPENLISKNRKFFLRYSFTSSDINNSIIKRESTVRFLGVLLDENLTWRPQNKISKYLGILYNARRTLNEEYTKQLYFSFIHSYLNYGSITWSSTNKTKLKTLHQRQKHAARIIYFKDRLRILNR